MQKQSVKTTLSIALGSGLEYYDFVIFGLMIKYTSSIFFADDNIYSATLKVFITFAAGYCVRPLGGFIFGIIADIYGRSRAFLAAMLIMAFSTFTIGLLPSYEQSGILAPILLIICRLLQGISFGAELPGAITIVSETYQRSRLGKMCSIILSGTTIGSLLAMITATIIANQFTAQEINNYAWRIPFLLGGTLAIITYFIRKNIAETSQFLENKHNNRSVKSILNMLRENFANLLIGIGIIFFMATLIITNLYFPVFISRNFAYELPQIFPAMTNSMVASIIFMIFFGMLSDRISKIKQLLFAVIGFSCSLIPLYYMLNQGNILNLQLFFIIYQFWIAAFVAACMPVISQLLPTSVRYSGTAIIYNIAFVFASTIPSIYEFFFAAKDPSQLGVIFIFAAMIALVSLKCLHKE